MPWISSSNTSGRPPGLPTHPRRSPPLLLPHTHGRRVQPGQGHTFGAPRWHHLCTRPGVLVGEVGLSDARNGWSFSGDVETMRAEKEELVKKNDELSAQLEARPPLPPIPPCAHACLHRASTSPISTPNTANRCQRSLPLPPPPSSHTSASKAPYRRPPTHQVPIITTLHNIPLSSSSLHPIVNPGSPPSFAPPH